MITQISRLMVANRGEIAARVFSTCRRLGIETVAVHSDADAGLPFVRASDLAVRLPGNAPAETYLDADLLIDAARRAGADAVHPGYGFLSENADFARRVAAAGLTWVGPDPEAIEAMGSKVRAKELMREAGVPVLDAPEAPTESDLPLLVKASAGGGGRGMRVVRRLADLSAEIEQAQAEAASAFGDGTVFVEPYVERGRHVEVQVVADRHGTVAVFGERDCSIQRRHQKVVEESPAPALPATTRTALHDAARAAAKTIGYVGAGTVEFLYDPEADRFYFLEMNTRLQVEHPVTEAVYGVDLVALQLAVAERSALDGDEQEPRGHAIEVRLYAEDPTQDWRPQSGTLSRLEIPHDDEFSPQTRGIRLDAGYESGSDVSTYYDAMLAKVIAWAPTRDEAARTLAGALTRSEIHGVVTNRNQLVDVLRSEKFRAGDVSTAYLAEHPATAGEVDRTTVIAGALMLAAQDVERRTVQRGIPGGWRNVPSQPHRVTFEGHEPVEWWGTRDGFAVAAATVLQASATRVRLEVDGVASSWTAQESAAVPGAPRELWVDGPRGSARLREIPRFVDPEDQLPSGSLLAPMPGSVVDLPVREGDAVTAGQAVVVLEAMKMQHTIRASTDGEITELPVEVGQQVASGEVLAVIEESSEGATA